jgi:hypothetical protein
MKQRLRLLPHEAEALGFKVKDRYDLVSNPKYYLDDQQQIKLKYIRELKNQEFKEVSRKTGKNGDLISKVEKLVPTNLINIPDDHVIKRVSTNVSTNQQWVITEPLKNVEAEIKDIDFKSIFRRLVSTIITDYKPNDPIYCFDRLVYTDTHIGMETNENGYSLYGGLWNEAEILKRCDIMISHTIENQKSKVLIVDDLGDFMDGWNGETTRKGHKLPQNMDNEKAFEVGLKFKTKIVDTLIKYYDRIIFHNVCNDNHSGAFAYVVNHAFKELAEYRYSNVQVHNIRKFIDHYIVGNRCFIISHGKDSKALKFGFKPKIDAVQIEKIKNYIDEHKLHQYEIEFSKGDSHQKLFDESSSDAFDYCNYGAFSPSSEWVQTNFKKGKSFIELFNYTENTKKHNPLVFKWSTQSTRNEIIT